MKTLSRQVSWLVLLSFISGQILWANPDLIERHHALAPSASTRDIKPSESHSDTSTENTENKDPWWKSRDVVGMTMACLVIVVFLSAASLINFLQGGPGLVGVAQGIGEFRGEGWRARLFDGVFGGILTTLQDQLRRYTVKGKKLDSEPRHPKVDRWRPALFFLWGTMNGGIQSAFYHYQNQQIPAEANLWTPALRTLLNRMNGAVLGYFMAICLVGPLAIWADRENGKTSQDSHQKVLRQYSYFNQLTKSVEGFFISSALFLLNGYFTHNFFGSEAVISQLHGDFRILYGWTTGSLIGLIPSRSINRPDGKGHALWRKINGILVFLGAAVYLPLAVSLSFPSHLSWGLAPLLLVIAFLTFFIPDRALSSSPKLWKRAKMALVTLKGYMILSIGITFSAHLIGLPVLIVTLPLIIFGALLFSITPKPAAASQNQSPVDPPPSPPTPAISLAPEMAL
ncbi:MAG: hypothetical protein HYS56_03875 [Candidatus Omnitrophica bacterium]|nr:hypothetical protein [Candidatus Omnitrophota bacterium]